MACSRPSLSVVSCGSDQSRVPWLALPTLRTEMCHPGRGCRMMAALRTSMHRSRKSTGPKTTSLCLKPKPGDNTGEFTRTALRLLSSQSQREGSPRQPTRKGSWSESGSIWRLRNTSSPRLSDASSLEKPDRPSLKMIPCTMSWSSLLCPRVNPRRTCGSGSGFC